MKFATLVALAGALSSAAAGSYKHGGKHKDKGTTYWVTEYAPSTSYVTVTKCAKGKCTPTAHPTGVTKTTTVHSGVTTEFTTYCPLTTSHEVVKSTCSDSVVVWSTKIPMALALAKTN